MVDMLVTALVSKLLRSKLVRDEQPLNAPPILVTELVSKPLRSKLVSDEQPENMPDIVVVEAVSNNSSPAIAAVQLKLENALNAKVLAQMPPLPFPASVSLVPVIYAITLLSPAAEASQLSVSSPVGV